jgi:hypothetical protein
MFRDNLTECPMFSLGRPKADWPNPAQEITLYKDRFIRWPFSADGERTWATLDLILQ